MKIEYSSDIRYVGQFNEVEVPITFKKNIENVHIQEMAKDFHRKHDQLYGYSLPGADLELINLRVAAYGITDKPTFTKAQRTQSSATEALKGYRDAFFEGQFVKVPVYDGLKMEYGHSVSGPCIIEQPTTTIIVPGEYALGCDEYNNYVMFHLELSSNEVKNKFGRV